MSRVPKEVDDVLANVDPNGLDRRWWTALWLAREAIVRLEIELRDMRGHRCEE